MFAQIQLITFLRGNSDVLNRLAAKRNLWTASVLNAQNLNQSVCPFPRVHFIVCVERNSATIEANQSLP